MTQTWQKPWFYGQGLLPCNITGKRYAGTNLLTLLMLTEVKGYRTPVFLTFRQAKERGLTVRKGSKQFPVVFWKPFTRRIIRPTVSAGILRSRNTTPCPKAPAPSMYCASVYAIIRF
ncbi:MAG: ArdC-like ssDNA-binding domain-containing protein [Alistipes finegoldii]